MNYVAVDVCDNAFDEKENDKLKFLINTRSDNYSFVILLRYLE